MFKLTIRQHSQILGWALIGFGIAPTLEVLRLAMFAESISRWLATPDSLKAGIEILIQTVLFKIVIAVSAFIAAMTAFDWRNPIRKILILFAVVAFMSFPLGTALSVYVLFYVYVINPEPEPEPVPEAAAEPE